MADILIANTLTGDTTLGALNAVDPDAVSRLAQIHPVFNPGVGVPDSASLGDLAKATGIPLDVLLATARGAIHVTALAGGCGCGSGGCGTPRH
ncbi:hypothetical protein FBY14_104346 [Azospirillum brasilense]|nr:hypothetical protein FBY14_104346 [Azospirillum brasilense]